MLLTVSRLSPPAAVSSVHPDSAAVDSFDALNHWAENLFDPSLVSYDFEILPGTVLMDCKPNINLINTNCTALYRCFGSYLSDDVMNLNVCIKWVTTSHVKLRQD